MQVHIHILDTDWPTPIARFMGPIWGRQDPDGPHVGRIIFLLSAKL